MTDRRLHPEDLLPSLSELVELLSEPILEAEEGLSVERLSIETPFEMQLIDGPGGVDLQASAPTQRTETTVLPVWHTLAVTVEVDDA